MEKKQRKFQQQGFEEKKSPKFEIISTGLKKCTAFNTE